MGQYQSLKWKIGVSKEALVYSYMCSVAWFNISILQTCMYYSYIELTFLTSANIHKIQSTAH